MFSTLLKLLSRLITLLPLISFLLHLNKKKKIPSNHSNIILQKCMFVFPLKPLETLINGQEDQSLY